MGLKRNACGVLVGKPDLMRPGVHLGVYGRIILKWNIKKEVELGVMD
jgi:hypothetical protein